MATQTTAIAIGEREDLSDVIQRIDPAETPLFSNMKVETVKAVYHEWLVQELASAVSNNANNEGADFGFATPTQSTRIGNYTQIFAQSAQVSNTLESVDKAGRAKEVAYQKVLKALEQRRDIDKTLCASVAQSSSEPRKFGAIECYVSNTSDASDATAITNHNGANLRTDGTARALSLSQIDTVMQACYSDGGQPDMLVVSPSKKATFSDLSSGSVVTNQLHMTSPQEATIIGSVSMYLTDFGTLDVVIDRNMQDDRVYLMDSEYMAMGALPNRQFSTIEVATTGDSQKFGIVSEFTYIPKAPKSHGAVYDLS